MNVLILSARAPVALEWARHFQAAHWQVFLADHPTVGKLSRQNSLAHTFISTPAPKHEPKAYIQTLIDAIERHRIDWLIPTCEEVFYVAKFLHLLPKHCRVLCADFDTLQRLHNKHSFNQLAHQLDIHAPASMTLQHESDTHWHIAHKRILKPVFSRFGHQVQVLAAFEAVSSNIPLDGSWLLQRFQEGQEYCSYSIALSGRLIAHQSYRGSYRYKRGASFYFDPIEHVGIKTQIETLVSALNFSGQISFDWMVDAHNRAFVLECNPRATSGLHLLAHDGALVEALLTQTPMPTFNAKAKMLLPMMLGYALPQALFQGNLKQWYRDYQCAEDVFGHWRHHLGALQDAWVFYRLGKAQNMPLEAATAADFVWDGQHLDEI